MDLKTRFETYRGAAANHAHTLNVLRQATEMAKKAQKDLDDASKAFGGAIGNGAYLHENVVYTSFNGQIIYAHPITQE